MMVQLCKRPTCMFLFTACAIGVLSIGANTASANSTLELVGGGPTGFVSMTAAPLGGYSGDDFYAGVLDWTDHPGSNSGADYFTYCVDISSVIGFGSTYAVTNTPVGTVFPSASAPGVANAIQNLWQDQPTAAQYARGYSQTAPAMDATANQNAEEFQIALWDIIYNYNAPGYAAQSNPNTPLHFGTPSLGSLQTALGWAQQAFADTRNNSMYTGVSILVAANGSGGQNQAIYIGGTGSNASVSSPVPLPASAGVGFSMLAGCGLLAGIRRRLGRARRIS